MEKELRILPKYNAFLDKEIAGRKMGVFLTAAVSLVNIILSLPFLSWIKLVNIPVLFPKLNITKDMAGRLFQSYSIFNLLSFVQESNQGAVGLYAMILLVIMAAVLYFNAAYLVKAVFGLKGASCIIQV